MNAYDAERDLERAARAHFEGRGDARTARLAGAAAYVAFRVLRDRHLSRAEEAQVEAALGRDFDPDEIAWVLDVLRRDADLVTAVRPEYWVDALREVALPGVSLAAFRREDRRMAVVNELEVRWPMLEEVRKGIRIRPEALRWDWEHLQVGEPDSIHSVTFAWRDLISVEPVDPWPSVLLEWKTRHLLGSTPSSGSSSGVSRSRVGPSKDPEGFERRVARLVELVRERAPLLAREGWLAYPSVSWELVPFWPGEGPTNASPSYRTAPARPIEVVAHRARAGSLHTILQWLVSSPDRPFRRMICEMAVTREHLYVRRRDGESQRLPLATLRGRRGGEDAIYVFGRSTEVLVGDRSECPVAKHLDERLRGRRAALGT